MIWSKVVPSSCHTAFFNYSFEDWISANIADDSLGNWKGSWAAYFCLVMRYVWKTRNDKAFNGVHIAMSTRQNYITAKATEWVKVWESANSNLELCSKPTKVETLIGWTAPTTGWWKVNTDGGAQSNPGMATAGGVIRNCYGDWIGGFCSKFGTGSALLAELWGIMQGLNLAWRKGAQFLILESDSQLALDLIKQRTDSVHPYSTILGSIRRLIAQSWVVQLVHTYREGNIVADWLSKHSLVYPFGTYELEEPPT
ncbi:unnamed protein product [Linum trigynum]|uniref:RNase H type-1 domain-containing protein n=1 Tax=Linum trigynum TaxID=586398 RepID=A0AAV2CC40_9ROSI